jgi:multidrug resistance efflux pump
MTLLHSSNINPRLLKALGLPENTEEFSLSCRGGELAVVRASYRPPVASGEALADLLTTEYELREREAPAPAGPAAEEVAEANRAAVRAAVESSRAAVKEAVREANRSGRLLW